jgi:hypothetical protein
MVAALTSLDSESASNAAEPADAVSEDSGLGDGFGDVWPRDPGAGGLLSEDGQPGNLQPVAGVSLPDTLAAAAVALYRSLRGGATQRDDALPLLAADALMTHALEAQAQADPAGLAAFAERWGAAGKLGELAV